MYKSGRGPFIALFLLLVLPVCSLVWLLQQRWEKRNASERSIEGVTRPSPTVDRATPTVPGPSSQVRPVEGSADTVQPPPTAPVDVQPPSQPAPGYVGKLDLIIPVLGVSQAQLQDTFGDARSEGRVHDAIDISAPLGTPVIAAADGEIIRLFESERGGTTIYQFSADKKLLYYYAHLLRYSDQVFPGKFVHQGETIAYVGDTGNAGAGNYHLHFSIAIVSDPKRYWEGESINPYPLLRK
jgi:murein DD-endopeptidase MepM/ murein hydrolase activator NlpD